jgi:hypothetical protein
MFDEFDGLDATEKAGIGAALNRCRALAAKIANELRNKRPEHFVDKLPLAYIGDFATRSAVCRAIWSQIFGWVDCFATSSRAASLHCDQHVAKHGIVTLFSGADACSSVVFII